MPFHSKPLRRHDECNRDVTPICTQSAAQQTYFLEASVSRLEQGSTPDIVCAKTKPDSMTISTPFAAKTHPRKTPWSWLVSGFAAGVFLFGAGRNGMGALLVYLLPPSRKEHARVGHSLCGGTSEIKSLGHAHGQRSTSKAADKSVRPTRAAVARQKHNFHLTTFMRYSISKLR